MKLRDRYEKETGEKALYRINSSDYHTLRYVNWLEAQIKPQHQGKSELNCRNVDKRK